MEKPEGFSAIDNHGTPIGSLETTNGGRLKIGLYDYGQGLKVCIQKLSKSGRVVQALSIDPPDGGCLVPFLATAVELAGETDFQAAANAMLNDNVRRAG